MEENAAALNTALNAVQALGRGFDVTSDIRLLYCKGAASSRLVVVDEENTKDLTVAEDLIVPNVPLEVTCSPGELARQHSGVLDFHQMAEHFNETVHLSGKHPLWQLEFDVQFLWFTGVQCSSHQESRNGWGFNFIIHCSVEHITLGSLSRSQARCSKYVGASFFSK
ncbi:hypothetical protein KI387_030469, partial [Taxus chinensis]